MRKLKISLLPPSANIYARANSQAAKLCRSEQGRKKIFAEGAEKEKFQEHIFYASAFGKYLCTRKLSSNKALKLDAGT